jgi:hypothetical protein
MLRISPLSIFAGAGTIAASLCAFAPAATSGSLETIRSQIQYLPIQSISHEFGSKTMSGFFVQQADACYVALMVIEKNALDTVPPPSAMRVRLVMSPGQVIGLDSEEGRSVNLTCGERAMTMLLDIGDRDKLVAEQSLALPNNVAKSH